MTRPECREHLDLACGRRVGSQRGAFVEERPGIAAKKVGVLIMVMCCRSPFGSRNSSAMPRGLRSASEASGSPPASENRAHHGHRRSREQGRARIRGRLGDPDERAERTGCLGVIATLAGCTPLGCLERGDDLLRGDRALLRAARWCAHRDGGDQCKRQGDEPRHLSPCLSHSCGPRARERTARGWPTRAWTPARTRGVGRRPP